LPAFAGSLGGHPPMELLLRLYTDQFLVFLLVLTRVSGVVTLAPVWGSRMMPMRVRAFLAIGLSGIIAPPLWGAPIEDPDNLLNLLVLMGTEFAVGLAIGLAVTIYFAGLQLAGQVMGQMTGMSLADVVSPTFDTSVPVFSEFLHVLMLSIFVVTGGHQSVLDALFESFHQLAPGHAQFAPSVLDALTEVTSRSFLLGLRIAAPMMVSLLLAILIMGLISRTLPQLNVLAVGFSVNSMVMLAAMLLSLGILARVFEQESLSAVDLVRAALMSGVP
jgi:flagellar biosynthesis protein FliR